MATQKPRIIPWLIEQINSQTYPGLEWINPERTRFQIPWKHGLRQDRSEYDVKIFEAWALASGSYNPNNDVPNPAVWKRNLRSALNRKSDICMIEDKSTDSTNPHKVYEFKRGGTADGNVTPEVFHLSISPSSDLPPFNSPRNQHNDGTLLEEITQMHISEDLYLAPEDFQNSVPADNWHNTNPSPELVLGATPVAATYMSYPEPSGQDITASAQERPQEQGNTVQQQLRDLCFPNNSFETQFEVKIYYRGTLIKKTLVTNPRGFHLTSKQHPNPEGYLEDVVLPPPVLIADHKVAAEIKKLLLNLEQGTQVEVHNGTIYARRLGKCRSFWSMTDTPAMHQSNPIQKEDFSELYNFQQFMQELSEFIEEKRKESPQYEIWICLGELWPDNKSWKTKLIMVQITPISMQLLHQLSYNNGASSLRSSDINLQISDSLSLNSKSEILTLLKEFEEIMDCS